MRKFLSGSALFLVGACSAFASGSLPSIATGVTKGPKASLAQVAAAPSNAAELVFVPIAPCRLVDTRPPFSSNGPLTKSSTTTFHAIGSSFAAQGGAAFDCGVASNAVAIAINIAMLHTTAAGDVRMWAADQTMPLAAVGVFSSENGTGVLFDGASAIIPICSSSCPSDGEFKVYAENSGLDLTVDVSGYFRPAATTQAASSVGQGLNWGTIARNVIGTATAQLRNDGTAPSGSGSLELTVGGPIYDLSNNKITSGDKVEFGNEVDFAGQSLSAVTAVGYTVKTTGENNALSAANMPAILIEINPGDGHATYSTLNYTPTANSPANAWTFVDAFADTNHGWGLTGSAYNSPATSANCGINGPHCTFAQILALVPNATILSVGVGKGRDFAWHGEIDSLLFNGTTYDFEPNGVVSIPTP
jgi:hypothetical protein